ncbi:hypothetical protein Ade02nite_33490 [Paractinoplanes deccanensis]|uniref:Uncharacterized protein n=1 Tax=Paractinoplanes deccanensis TaxID=113561 RepID=A0ABQ3Y3Z8_9ACTN|nr:hypothetical protein Ade02nite_33490 [Actinoplanes deccanensis]
MVAAVEGALDGRGCGRVRAAIAVVEKVPEAVVVVDGRAKAAPVDGRGHGAWAVEE